jgi:CO/xanthine dehydrogenase FAD-binding subunit
MTHDKQVFVPKNLNELDRILAKLQLKATYVSGATDIMVQQKRWNTAQCIINMDSVDEIRHTLDFQKEGLLIGAALPITDLIQNSLMSQKFPILVYACQQIGGVQIQNRATLGGNIANASPAGDSLPVLAVLNAEIWIGPRQKGNFTKLKLDKVIIGPGETSLDGNKYIAYVFLPYIEPPNYFWYFRKVGQRYAMAISKVSLALLGWIKENILVDIRICTGSVLPQIKRAQNTEAFLKNHTLNNELIYQARDVIMQEVHPITDIRSTTNYRRNTSGALLVEALNSAKLEAEGNID